MYKLLLCSHGDESGRCWVTRVVNLKANIIVLMSAVKIKSCFNPYRQSKDVLLKYLNSKCYLHIRTHIIKNTWGRSTWDELYMLMWVIYTCSNVFMFMLVL